MIEAIFGNLWPIVVGIIMVIGSFLWVLDFLSDDSNEQVKEDAKCPHCKNSLVLRVGKGRKGGGGR